MQYESRTHTEKLQTISKIWHGLDEVAKRPYESAYQADMVIYTADTAIFKERNTASPLHGTFD